MSRSEDSKMDTNKVQSEVQACFSLYLMIMVLKPNQAALLFTQLLVVWHVFAEFVEKGHRGVMVITGDSVTLTCNISEENATQISWTNGRSLFQHSIVLNRTFSNFSFYKLKINHQLPPEITVFSAQPEDEGLYTCSITGKDGLHSITWNLTVSGKPKKSISKYFLSILSPAIGFILCGIMLAVFLCSTCWTALIWSLLFLCKKGMTRTLNQDPVEDQFPPESEEGTTAHLKNNTWRSQYTELQNSIYGHF
ncbi:large subunit ribosomal protein L32e [Sarotherodon galilaeus]